MAIKRTTNDARVIQGLETSMVFFLCFLIRWRDFSLKKSFSSTRAPEFFVSKVFSPPPKADAFPSAGDQYRFYVSHFAFPIKEKTWATNHEKEISRREKNEIMMTHIDKIIHCQNVLSNR